MKSKNKLSFLVCVCAAPMIFGLASCNNNKHEHTFDSVYSNDDTYHWKKCTHEGCNEIAEKAAHVYDDDSDFDCNVCDYIRQATTENLIQFKSEKLSYEYNRLPRELKVGEDFTVSYGTPTVSYKLANEDETAYSDVAPTNAGKYTVKVDIGGNAI